MSVRTRTRIILVASLDDDEKQCQFSRPDASINEVIENFDVESSGEIELAASEADYALPLGKVVGGRLLYIETTGDLTIKLDGEVTGHKIGTPASGTKAKLFLRSEFSSAPTLTNNSATAVAPVSFMIAGTKS